MAEGSAVTLKTTGMHCQSCSMLVDMTLNELPGVSESHTDLASGLTKVDYDPDAVSVDALLEAVRSVGYEAEVV